MSPVQSRIDELHELLAAFVEHPRPGALVVGCVDPEVVYLLHTLVQLDAECPADRIYLVQRPFLDPIEYIQRISDEIQAFTGQQLPSDPDPTVRLRVAVAALLAGLPDGDHRLIVALVPSLIDDAPAFASLIHILRSEPLSSRLRLIFREDLETPHALTAAEQSTSDQFLAYHFHLPASLVVECVRSTAQNPTRSPDERAHAIMELAVHDYGHGHHADAITACDAVIASGASSSIVALALVVRADTLRALDRRDEALTSASRALHLAVESETPPIIHHAAMTLGELSSELGNIEDAVRSFHVAELAVPNNEDAQSLARERRLALRPPPC